MNLRIVYFFHRIDGYEIVLPLNKEEVRQDNLEIDHGNLQCAVQLLHQDLDQANSLLPSCDKKSLFFLNVNNIGI